MVLTNRNPAANRILEALGDVAGIALALVVMSSLPVTAAQGATPVSVNATKTSASSTLDPGASCRQNARPLRG